MELHFTKTNGPADDAIEALMQLVGGVQHPEIVREMILAALKAGQEGRHRADLKLMNTTLKEMRFTTKIFGAYRHVKKVSVFGSARTQPRETAYQMARLLGRQLAEAGYMVITGGGPGIMHAVNEGAGSDHSFGVNIRLPFEQKLNSILEGSPRNITYKYFFNRKVAFIKEAHAIVLFPGGFGTLDEAMETLTLLQTGKRDPMPIVLVDEPGGTYWARWYAFIEKELLARDYVYATDFKLFECVDDVAQAVARIDCFYKNYHSQRYVGEKLVMRLNREVESPTPQALKTDFADLLLPSGDMVFSGPLPEEDDEPEIAHLPRLVVDFNRKDFGRLRKLIDALNGCDPHCEICARP